MRGFSVEGSTKSLGSFFGRRGKILLLDDGPKFGVIFHKFVYILLKFEELVRKEKMQIFLEKILIIERDVGKKNLSQ